MPKPFYMDRELSWMNFNIRVLEEAEDPSVPLFEQLSFSAIYQSNLDEFVQVRLGAMLDRAVRDPKDKDSRSGMKPKDHAKEILHAIGFMLPRKDRAYHDTMSRLKEHGIEHVTFSDATPEERSFLEQYFKREVKPLLSPIIVDKNHPFPFLRNKKLYVVVQLAAKSGVQLGLIPAYSTSGRVVRLGKSGRFTLLEDIILHFAPQTFKNYKVLDSAILRVTRSGVIEYDSSAADEGTDFCATMEKLIAQRRKREVVRLQMNSSLAPEAMEVLLKKLGLKRRQLFFEETPLDLSFVYKIAEYNDDPALHYPPHKPQNRSDISARRSMMSQIAERDILLSYPYESVTPFLRLLDEASIDPDVASIKITLYRVASNSRVVEALCQAAENGKDVLVLVELRARFDEENNIGWAKRLQDAGCTVIYGPHNMKVHSKLLLISRRTEDGVQNIVQVGTGNYNEKTNRIYTDLCLMTANTEIAADARHVFDALSTDSLVEETKQLMVAPLCMRSKILELLDEEIAHARRGEPAFFSCKCNSISDRGIMNKLAEASQAGVQIEMVVRGICCLKPGVPGFTDNIHIVSIVGRYLEHSRIYIFGTPERRRVYISSADLMTRNTKHRIEVGAPLLDPALMEQASDIVALCLADNVKARIGEPDGTFLHCDPVQGEGAVDAQEMQYRIAEKKAKSRKKK